MTTPDPLSPARHAARLAPAVVICWAVGSLAGLVVALAGLNIDRAPTVAAAETNLRALWPFWIASASGWAALTAVWALLCRRTPQEQAARAGRVSLLVVGVAVLARLAVLLTHQPALSDDVYRYTFDGRNLAHGVNPYVVRPQDRIQAHERWPGEAAVAALVNNPELHTIYLPASQWVFAGAGLLTPSAWSSPQAAARVYRAVFIAFDVAVIGLLLLALRRAGRSPWWAALYAWHPLPVTEIAGTGHQESVGIALLVAALLVAAPTMRRAWQWTSLLAFSALVKPVVLPVAALVLKGQGWRAWALSLATGVVVCAAVAAPLWAIGDADALGNFLETSERFRLKWAHFGSVYEPVLWTIERVCPQCPSDRQEVWARRLCLAVVAAVVVGAWWRMKGDTWKATRVILTAMVLLSPAAHPWYLLWALALVPMAFGPAAWVASLTLPWGYAALGHVTPQGAVAWGVSPWLMAAAYAPVYAAVAADLALKRRRQS
ncbi:MAG: glycosyltransferase 87 family protein [Planctomycetota bacterium]